MMFTVARAEQFTGNCVARALYDNIAETPDELAFRKGDILTVLEQNTSGLEGWWLCMLRGRQGICPANRLRLMPRVYDTGGQPYSVNGQLNSSGGSNSSTSSSSSSSNSSSSARPVLAAKPGLLSAAVRAHQQKQQQQQLNGHLFRPVNNKLITLSRQSEESNAYPEECYDMPRSLMVQQLGRQESISSDYQEPRSHNVNRQLSAPDEGGADYDVPRPHHGRVLHTRTLSIDSSCEYDVPRPSSSTETYDTPRSSTTTTASSGILDSSSPSPPEECYDVPSGIAVRFVRTNGKNPSDRSSGISLFSSESSSSAARSTSSEDSLSLSSAVGQTSGRSSRSSVGIVGPVDLPNQSMDLYDVPSSAQPAQQSIQEETYDILPKPIPVPAENDSLYDVPPPPVTTVDAVQIYDIPPPSKRTQDVQQQQTYDCPKPLLDLPANKANTLPLSFESAMETLERLDAEVSSALTNLLSFWQASQVAALDWAELQLRVLRLRASLQELCDFTRGAVGNAVRRDDLLAVKLARLSRPLQDANSIVQKTSQGWTDLFALNSRRRPGNGNNYELEQLLACCRNLGGDMKQVVTFIQTNGHLLFITAAGKGTDSSSTVQTNTVNSTATGAMDDYDYVNLESKAKSDQDNEEIKSTLPNNDMKKAFDVLMAQSETLPHFSPNDQVSDNDRSVVEFYVDQVETYVGYLSNAIDSFIQTIECNQPPKVFVAYSKFVILNAHKLLCVGDTVHRNVGNAKLKAKVLERSNQLCQGLQTCVQSTKRAGREFPSVVAVQDMLDSVLVVSKLAQGLKTCLLQPIMQSK